MATTSSSSSTDESAKPPPEEESYKGKIMIFRAGKWIIVPEGEMKDLVTFDEIKYFYANIIDYVRVLMCVLAGFTVLWEWHITSAVLILGSTLLDWVDGPVARMYGQCSIFGSGIDWTADILCQLVTVIWWVQYDRSVLPWLMIAVTVEVTTAIFDYATTATCKYPLLQAGQTGFNYILELSMPGGNYTSFGIFLWLAYPFYSVFRCLQYAYAVPSGTDSPAAIFFLLNDWLLLVPAIMYIWCEAAFGMHMIRSWTEPSRKAKPDHVYWDSVPGRGGFINFGILDADQQKILLDGYNGLDAETRANVDKAVAKHEIFWYNIWQRPNPNSKGPQRKSTIEPEPNTAAYKLRQLATQLYEKYYAGEGALDGYGIIINPAKSTCQDWHLDYSADYSTIFVPISKIGPHNATQYLHLESPCTDDVFNRAVADPDHVDVSVFTQNNVLYTTRQLVGPPFSILRMDFATIHRGIANTSDEHRVVFYFSVKGKVDEYLDEEEDAQFITK